MGGGRPTPSPNLGLWLSAPYILETSAFRCRLTHSENTALQGKPKHCTSNPTKRIRMILAEAGSAKHLQLLWHSWRVGQFFKAPRDHSPRSPRLPAVRVAAFGRARPKRPRSPAILCHWGPTSHPCKSAPPAHPPPQTAICTRVLRFEYPKIDLNPGVLLLAFGGNPPTICSRLPLPFVEMDGPLRRLVGHHQGRLGRLGLPQVHGQLLQLRGEPGGRVWSVRSRWCFRFWRAMTTDRVFAWGMSPNRDSSLTFFSSPKMKSSLKETHTQFL